MSHSQKSQQRVCLSCKKPEGAVSGSSYISNGDNGMIVRFWLCDDCAMTLGPSQGPIDMDEPEAHQQRV